MEGAEAMDRAGGAAERGRQEAEPMDLVLTPSPPPAPTAPPETPPRTWGAGGPDGEGRCGSSAGCGVRGLGLRKAVWLERLPPVLTFQLQRCAEACRATCACARAASSGLLKRLTRVA